MPFAPYAAAETAADVPVLTHTVVLSKLDNPWDMAFLPDGTIFFTEKCKGLSARTAAGKVVPLLGMKDSKGYADTAADLFCEGQAGMQGVTVDPDFAKNRFIYVYSTSSLTAPGTNRVLRLKVSDNFGKVSDRTDIIADIPYKISAHFSPAGQDSSISNMLTAATARNPGRPRALQRYGPTSHQS